MRRHLSILALCARHSLIPILAVLAVTAAAQLGLFAWALAGQAGEAPARLEDVLDTSKAAWVCFVAYGWVLVLLLSRFYHAKHTIRRLSIPEEAAVLWEAGYNTVCLLALWAAQAAVAVGMCLLYAKATDPAYVSEQTVLLALYRVPLFHGLLPLASWSGWVRNVLFCLLLGMAPAVDGYRQRMGTKFSVYGLVVSLMTFLFPREVGAFTGDMILSALALGCLAMYVVFLFTQWRGGAPDEG